MNKKKSNRMVLKEGTPVNAKGKRGLLKALTDDGRLVVDVGHLVTVNKEDVQPLLCVGATVEVRCDTGLQEEWLMRRTGKVIRRQRAGRNRALVLFNDKHTQWMKVKHLLIVKPAPPRLQVKEHPCANAKQVDWGIGLASCRRCAAWPILNRGCSNCNKKLCSTCLLEHHLDSDDEDDEEEVFQLKSQLPDYHNPATRPVASIMKQHTTSPISGYRRVGFVFDHPVNETPTKLTKSPPPSPLASDEDVTPTSSPNEDTLDDDSLEDAASYGDDEWAGHDSPLAPASMRKQRRHKQLNLPTDAVC